MSSDRIFGVIAALVALAYIASATQIESGFMTDPVGPKGFPLLIGIIAAISSIMIVLRPDEEPTWPGLRTLGALLFSVVVLICYAYALKPMGFLYRRHWRQEFSATRSHPASRVPLGRGWGFPSYFSSSLNTPWDLASTPFPNGS